MIVAFGGKRFSGKSTAERYLVEDKLYVPHRFSDRLREIFSEVSGIDVVKYEDWDRLKDSHEINGLTLRRHLCNLADSIKEINPTYFTDYLIKKIRNTHIDFDVVVTDVRFQHEFDAIRSMGGIMIKLERDCSEENTFIHNSENGLDGWDVIINNDGSINQLENRILEYVQTRQEFSR